MTPQEYLDAVNQKINTAPADAGTYRDEMGNEFSLWNGPETNPNATLESELAKWRNLDTSIDPNYFGVFSAPQKYFKQGQFDPGSSTATPEVYAQYQNRIAADQAPSGFDKIFDVALPMAIAAFATAGVGGLIGAPAATGTAAATGTTFETALTNAGIAAGKNAAIQFAITGKVDPKGLIGAGLGAGVASYLPTVDGIGAAGNAALKGATSGGIKAAVTGGDVLKGAASGAVSSAVGPLAKDFAKTTFDTNSNAISGGFAGAITGSIQAAIYGQDIGKGALGGAIAGGVAGIATDKFGATGTTAGLIGTVAGSAATKTDQADSVVPTKPVTVTPTAPSAFVPSFAAVLPLEYQSLSRDTIDYAARGQNLRGA
ncbi:MAG: hypothetical protein WC073_11420 [Sterolibacterium sp.]